MTVSQQTSNARGQYQQTLDEVDQRIAALAEQQRKMIWVRTLLFFTALGCLVLGYGGTSYQVALLSVGWLSAVGFLYAIVRNEHQRLAQLNFNSDRRLYQRLLARIDRDWEQLPSQSLLPEFSELPYADDLDIAGDASLLTLISLVGTHPGNQTLQSWLATPPEGNVVLARQAAIRKLVPERDFRLATTKTILSSSAGTHEPYGLPEWSTTENWLPKHPFARLLSYVGPTCVISGIILVAIFSRSENQTLMFLAAGLLGSGFLINILVTALWGSWIHDIFQKVGGEHRAVFRFSEVFASLGALPSDNGLLDEIKNQSVAGSTCAKIGFSKLRRIVFLASFQHDPVLYGVYLCLQLLILWDFRILKLLEAWKDQYGSGVGAWFDALGRYETLASCATLADEYPRWCFPSVPNDQTLEIHASEMGHPLLPDAARVDNDLHLLTGQPLLMVTGSNMAGKSTFMRALGLNILLARTGSPVCATEFTCPHFELATSIRVRDSLKDGVSFFMAELKRLKQVVDLAEAHAPSENHDTTNPAPVLFMLDEVLQGTNSRERLIAVASVIEKLLSSGARGVVSTHDLDLAAAEQIQTVGQIVHFREYFETEGDREVMRFDYKMRPGPTPTTNALKLLKLVGLDTQST